MNKKIAFYEKTTETNTLAKEGRKKNTPKRIVSINVLVHFHCGVSLRLLHLQRFSHMEAITHIALVSNPAFSHQVSILEFAKRLVHNHNHLHHHHQHYHNFHVTCIIPTLSNSSSPTKLPFFDSLPPTIQCIFLPPVDFEDLRNGEFLESQVQLSVSRSMPSVRETLRSLATRSNVVALVVDAFAHEALEFGKELNILSYIYFPCSMMVLSLCLHSSRLDETISCEFRDYPKPIEIPGQ